MSTTEQQLLADNIIEIYQGEKLAFEIERTRSRLLEMQSDDYLQEAHRQIQNNSELAVE